jgi:regulator of ribonuclease activity A
MFTTADLSDANPETQIADPLFNNYGGQRIFYGLVVTVKVFEDNVIIRALLEKRGDGQVLVVDGGGSMRCALIGGDLAQIAADNGWRGIVVNGCIRDSEELRRRTIGIKALGTHPRKSEKGLHCGHCGHAVRFAGVTFTSGQWLYADADGIVIAEVALHKES